MGAAGHASGSHSQILYSAPLCRWQQKYFEAKTSLQDRDNKVAEVSELVERNLVLLGCTAIEDKLQVRAAAWS